MDVKHFSTWTRVLSGAMIGILFVAVPSIDAQGPSPTRAEASRQTDERPAGNGLQLLSKACGLQCHNLRPIVLQKRDLQQWRRNIYLMISRGAQVLPAEIDPLAAQLAAQSNQRAAAPTNAEPGAALPEGRGQAVLLRSCVSSCHAVEALSGVRLSLDGWNDAVARMKRIGVVISADEQTILIEYLATTFGAGQ